MGIREYLNEINDEAREEEENAQWQDHQGRGNRHDQAPRPDGESWRNERERRRRRTLKIMRWKR